MDDRISMLREKLHTEGLSTSEMGEYLLLTGSWWEIPMQAVIIHGDIKWPTAMHNVEKLRTSLEQSMERGFLLEAVTCLSYLIEYTLLAWCVARGALNRVEPDSPWPSLGDLISGAAEAGMTEQLIRRGRHFQGDRNRAIHRMIAGEVSYESLERLVVEHRSLLADLHEEACREVAARMATSGHEPGDATEWA